MTTAKRALARLDLEVMIPGQAGQLRFTALGAETGPWTFHGGRFGTVTLTPTVTGDDLVLTWTGAEATALIGKPWALRQNGHDRIAGDARRAKPGATSAGPEITVVLGNETEITVTIELAGSGATAHEDLTGRNDPEQHTADAIEVPGQGDLAEVLELLGGYTYSVDLRVLGAEGDIDALEGDVEGLQAADTTLEGRVDTLEAGATTATAARTALGAGVAQAEDRIRSEALARTGTAPCLQVGLPEGSEAGYSNGAYTTTAPASFTTGMWVRFTVTPLDIGPDVDGTTVFTSPFVWKAEAPDGWYTVRVGVLRIYDAAAGAWRLHLYAGFTQVDGTVETIVMSTSAPNGSYPAWEMALAAPTEVAVWLDCENGDGVWDLQFLRRTHFGTADATYDGAEWDIVARAVGTAPATIATSAQPWTVGHGHGELQLDAVQIRDEGPDGPMLANPTGALAAAAGEGQPFDDAQSNTWTPGPDAAVHFPIRPAVNMDGGEIGSHTGAVRVTDNGTFTLPTLTEADHGRHLWLYVAAAGATIDTVVVPGTGEVSDYALTDDTTVLLSWYGYGGGYWFVALDTTPPAASVTYGLEADTAVEGIALPRTAWRTGSYYGVAIPTAGSAALNSGVVRAMPFYNPVAGRSIDQLAIDVVTATGSPAGFLYLCLDDGNGYPGAVVASGAITPAAASRVSASVSYALPRGQLWIVAHGTVVTWAGVGLAGQSTYLPASASYTASSMNCWQASGAGTSALSAFPAGAVPAANGVQVLLRAA